MKRGGGPGKGGGQDPLTPPSGHAYDMYVVFSTLLIYEIDPLINDPYVEFFCCNTMFDNTMFDNNHNSCYGWAFMTCLYFHLT